MEFFTKILTSPSLVWVLPVIGFYLINIFMGLFIAFQKKTAQNLRIHALMYYSITFSLICFLIMNQTHHENTSIDYIVVFYIVAIVPLSKRWGVLFHALIATVGLTLLPLLIIIQI